MSGRVIAEDRGAAFLEHEVDDRRAHLVQGCTSGLQIASRHDRGEGLIRIGVGSGAQPLRGRRSRVVRGTDIVALVDVDAIRDFHELQLTRTAERLDGLFRIIDAGQFDDDAVLALKLDQRFGHTEAVHATLDDNLGSLHVFGRNRLTDRGLRLKEHLSAALQV